MTGLRLAVFASGRGSDLQSILDAQARGAIQSRVALVITDQPGARAYERARNHDVPAEELLPLPDLKGPQRRAEHEARIQKVLDHFKIDLIVLAGYMRLLSPEFCRRYAGRIINIHPSLLPSFPGLHAQRQALDWGAGVAGCTTHFVDEKTDHGPIILQAAIPIRPEDDEESLSRRILELEHQILPRTINLIEEGRVRIEGRRTRIQPSSSWKEKLPVPPGATYSAGY